MIEIMKSKEYTDESRPYYIDAREKKVINDVVSFFPVRLNREYSLSRTSLFERGVSDGRKNDATVSTGC